MAPQRERGNDLWSSNDQKLIDEAIRAAVEAEREACAEIAERHQPARFRGGYADGLIEGDPMWDIATSIRARRTT